MESYIPITHLNDYIFCPRSIYLHAIYSGFKQNLYHRAAQTIGKIKHENIEEGAYSTAKRYLHGMSVYSEKYCLMGKIDVYDIEEEAIIERKNKVNKIYDGYRCQLYAHYFCLTEMGYPVKKLFLHSLSDNKRYSLALPSSEEQKEFEALVQKVAHARAEEMPILENKAKCAACIYKPLCH
ncbi:MAG: type V CRISPR-associated protein Cas4 [Candidatus Jacksonbacteria bacterium RIFCSPLOWO2_02_FULL_44_20]|uniref:Type V CRISPR-associated protein Cas4 n=1 Tax=Candidatus Jacksonbacteria bacterium RIFCSPLOWO2_02_FULL_44_20 TaxID=1798460 RepID=A0A1G2AD94_9BACT|nr:MAG: RecB family exonuclease, CRISPR protein based HMM [Parcubacteria group bacterium GW2011_GWF2_44_17]OGY70091.1 MAG: type V CRISPR-associated protein Cas4 [Candidatus Jacksonbacteria bacterium RIFCSPHIGHO2_12_FULL_44_12]OGY71701.1 MAG: type V CRISPR-associated protein Cas4 [Candidatus Jacksonbacteria bacterium RIFCSPHIGHO2_02_FULL_44_25]OGY73987.1 MAG: type V CRISPR-associated protein Cas4 [Candidatus Jacksonbacteria bacterium RIFCSPLOWO2_02_FULL_44_20]OGY74077.1 MAG: type V CRISPR-associ